VLVLFHPHVGVGRSVQPLPPLLCQSTSLQAGVGPSVTSDSLLPCEGLAAGLVVTAGAGTLCCNRRVCSTSVSTLFLRLLLTDKAVCALDPRAGFSVLHRFTEHRDFPYSLAVAGGLALSGAGDGLLIAHDLTTGKPIWGLGANAAAVRFIGVARSRLVAAGDDGKAIVYAFPE